MSWSFDDSLGTDRDKVRLKTGLTDTQDQLLSNETIDALLAIRSDVVLCSIDCVKAVLALLARDIDRSAVGMSASRSQKITHFELVLKNLVKESTGSVTMKVGGISKDAADTLRDNTDFIKPTFDVGMNNYINPNGGTDNGWNCD